MSEESQLTLRDCFNVAVTGLIQLLSHAMRGVPAEQQGPLAADVDSGKAALFFEVTIHNENTNIRGFVKYSDGRRIECFEDRISAPKTSNTTH
jgi:hypothetical protein